MIMHARSKDSPVLDRRETSVLVVAAKWWPLSARLASALRRHGCTVDALCPAGHPLRHVSGIQRFHRYDGIFSLASLRRALLECEPDVVIPCDDGVVTQLHALHESEPSLRPLVERSLGAPESYSVVESRRRFLDMALELGIRVPRTKLVERTEDLAAWHDHASSAVLKVGGESGGNGVRISHSLNESLAAWRELRKPYGLPTAWKRLMIDQDPLALWMRQRQRVREVTVQDFIPGRPANSMLACWRGKVLSMVSVAVVAAEGPTGAATIVRLIQNESMKRAAKLIASRLKLSGFYGLDFILEFGTNVPYLIEMNPRCTQLGHIEFTSEGCLAAAFSAVLRGEPSRTARNPISSEKIALFPQALAAGEACRWHIAESYHDVPFEEPKLHAELILKSWPHRQRAARLYHAFKPLGRAEPVFFEEIASSTVALARG